MEYWKIIDEFPEYQVSNYGNVKKTSTDMTVKQTTSNGYKIVNLKNGINCKKLSVHRLVCEAFCENEEKKPLVDHINHNKSDNHYRNLRFCTSQENNRNRSISKHNTSGVTGVHFRKDKNKWQATIKVGENRIQIGYFKTLEEAKAARLKKEKELFKEFSPN